jgi:toxin ParE1/3/4
VRLYRITDPAAADLREIWIYIAKDSPRAADRLVDRIQRLFPKLADTPAIGRTREELAPLLRSLPVGNYLIFYRPFPDGIEITRVLHGARDLEAVFQEPESD